MSHLTFTPSLDPPLGITTTWLRQDDKHIPFRCVMTIEGIPESKDSSNLEVSRESYCDDFTVLLWWSIDGRGIWQPAAFERIDSETLQEVVFDYSPDRSQSSIAQLFNLSLDYDGDEPLQFCLKYRYGDGPWLWEGSRIGNLDGRLLIQRRNPGELEPLPLRSIFLDGDPLQSYPHAKVQQHIIETDHIGNLIDVQVFELSYPLESIFPCSPFVTDTKGLKQTAELSLGKIANLEQWMALVKIGSPWMGPIHSTSAAAGGGGASSFTTNKDCLLVLLGRRDSRKVAILPMSGIPREGNGTCSSYITSSSYPGDRSNSLGPRKDPGEAIWRVHNESPDSRPSGSARCLIAIGYNPDNVVSAAFSVAGKIMEKAKKANASSGVKRKHATAFVSDLTQPTQSTVESVVRSQNNPPSQEDSHQMAEDRNRQGSNEEHSIELKEQRLRVWYEGFSYCTWNALGAELTPDKILGALEELDRSGVRVCSLIIDDNWQSLDSALYTSSGTWSRFEANSHFDAIGGLKGMVTAVRTKYPYIQYIGVWHALVSSPFPSYSPLSPSLLNHPGRSTCP
jgi:Raffinose synthase or seed imbibition protein Sip1